MLKRTLSITIFILFIVNVILFSKSVILSDSIQNLESNIQKVKMENEELEKQMYSAKSLDNLDKLAPELGFTKKAEPLYLESLRYAQAR